MKCPKCGSVPYPWFDENKKPIWKNILRIDWGHMFIILSILLIVFGYKSDMKQCDDVINDPCGFCEKSHCCIIPESNDQWLPTPNIITKNESMYIS